MLDFNGFQQQVSPELLLHGRCSGFVRIHSGVHERSTKDQFQSYIDIES